MIRSGFTLVELLIVVVLVGVLASIATRSFHDMAHRARVARATQEIRGLEAAVFIYQTEHHQLPGTLAEAGVVSSVDPWGNDYVYVPFESSGTKGGKSSVGSARKDRFLVPLNSDFDLYSKGRDGESKSPLTAPVSHDDVLRANDGGFIGLAENY